MPDKPTRRYGPVDWADSVRDFVKPHLADNNDCRVTQETVNQWLANADEFASTLRHDHEKIIKKLKP